MRARERERMLKREREREGKWNRIRQAGRAGLDWAVQGISQVFLATVLFINQLSFLCTRLVSLSPYCSPPGAAVNRCT